jgi:hypothetical protein
MRNHTPSAMQWRKRVGLCLVLLALAGAVTPVSATEEVIFGPAQYTRTGGSPDQFMETIALPPTLAAPFRLHVQNGNPDGTYRVSGATIMMNGTQIAGPSDFSQQVAAFDRAVTLLASNTLQVRLTSKPGSFLVLSLHGTIPPPRLIRLELPTLPITQGGTGGLTATISAVQPTETLVTLSSDSPAVATVPPAVKVPANQLSAAIPVAGIGVGTAIITAALNGSAVHSTVTVVPAGPIPTGLSPDILRITRGASGALTVTISATQASETTVALTSSDSGIVSLAPADSVIVPAGHSSQTFAVFGVGQGTATIIASLNGRTAQSPVTVVIPLPQIVSLAPPRLPLTQGSAGTLTVTLNASLPDPAEVVLSTSDATIVGLPADPVTVPAHTSQAIFSVTGLARGTATVTASLAGTSATAAVEVLAPPPTVQSLICPATFTVGATSLCSVTLNATQLTENVVSLSGSDAGVVSLPPSVTVPADTLSASFAVTGQGVGRATITAGPLNGTCQTATIQVVPPPPTIESLTPATATISVGGTATLALTLNAAQPEDVVIDLASFPVGILSVPVNATVPKGTLSVTVPITGLTSGTAILTAGPLHGTQGQSTITVNQRPPAIEALTPAGLSLPEGRAGILTVSIAPTQSEPTVVLLTGEGASVEVPPSVTVQAGSTLAEFPVVARMEGSATITAGPLNDTGRTAIVTVTPAELVTLAITPPAPTIPKGETQAFLAEGIYTNGSTRDLTGVASWTSGDERVATITSPGGVATGRSVGQATIAATNGSASATAALTVGPPHLRSLTIGPDAPSKAVGDPLQFQATGTLTDGTTQDVTALVAWTSDTATVASISAAGLATALAPGTATITATHPDGFTASTTLTVVLAPPALTGFSPSAGPVGTTVTLIGTNLGSTTAITFNGVPAAFVVASPLQLTATVPTGTTTGSIVVTTPSGSAISAMPFTVLVPPTLTITTPVNGATINATSVQVRGTVGAATGEIGVSVNGFPAFVNSGQWVVEVPLTPGSNTLSVIAVDATGAQATASLSITVSQTTPVAVLLQALPTSGVSPLAVTWQVINQSGHPLVQFELDETGAGTFGPQMTSFDGVTTTYAAPRLASPTLRATDDQGTVYTATTLVNIEDPAGVTLRFQARWNSLKASLSIGDIAGALAQLSSDLQARFQPLFQQLGPALPQVAAGLGDLRVLGVVDDLAEGVIVKSENGTPYLYFIYFRRDGLGRWLIEEM